MFEFFLALFSHYLIEFMALMLVSALIFRLFTYKSSKLDDIYFSTFTKEIEKCLDQDKVQNTKIEKVDQYLSDLLNRVATKLPNRSLRFSQNKQNERSSMVNAKSVVSLRDYVGGQKSLINSINTESTVFNSPHPPNYNDLTRRILNQDRNWVNLFGIIPIEGISRMIDILPGLFIVFGVFGTFIGISNALPQIAKIDFNNLDAAAPILSSFVTNVTFAMRTSIAGILFSLILTFLNTMFPTKGLRNATFKKVANCFEAIWFAIHGGSTLENEINTSLLQLVKSFHNIEKHLINAHSTVPDHGKTKAS